MAESKQSYGIAIQVCVICTCVVLTAIPNSIRRGIVDLAYCPAVDEHFVGCYGKMVPLENTEKIGNFLTDLAGPRTPARSQHFDLSDLKE